MKYEDETVLEAALRISARDAGHRAEFYRLLLTSQVYVLSRIDLLEGAERTVPDTERMPIQHWRKDDGSPFVPFFSSMRTLQHAITREVHYFRLSTKALFALARDTPLVLNPRSSVKEEFVPSAVAALLAETAHHCPPKRVAARVTLDSPNLRVRDPMAVVNAFTVWLSREPLVRAAYVARTGNPPCFVIAIEIDKDAPRIIDEASAIATKIRLGGENVAVMRIARGDGGFGDDLVKNVRPFYVRTWQQKLRSWGFMRE